MAVMGVANATSGGWLPELKYAACPIHGLTADNTLPASIPTAPTHGEQEAAEVAVVAEAAAATVDEQAVAAERAAAERAAAEATEAEAAEAEEEEED